MRTRTLTLKIDVPVNDAELLKDLDDLHKDPRVASAERVLAAATQKLETLNADLQRASADVNRCRGAVVDGRAVPADLDNAIALERRAALLIPPAQQAIATAQNDVAAALEHAKERALRLVNERFETLLRADRVLVEQLNALDDAMDTLTSQLAKLCFEPTMGRPPARFDQRGRTGEFPNRARGVPPTIGLVTG
jgi:predicted RNase H-like nuclease (RuvC/YqgF family)